MCIRDRYKVVGPIEVKFKNRRTLCHAMVLSGDSEIVLGKTQILAMDVLIFENNLIINPKFSEMAHSRI